MKKIQVELTELDLEIIWMCLVDSKHLICQKQREWMAKQSLEHEVEDNQNVTGAYKRTLDRINATTGTIAEAKRRLNGNE
jgi:hypothetical protein